MAQRPIPEPEFRLDPNLLRVTGFLSPSLGRLAPGIKQEKLVEGKKQWKKPSLERVWVRLASHYRVCTGAVFNRAAPIP